MVVPVIVFQSLSRDSGRLNRQPTLFDISDFYRFNPSVGIRGV